MNKELLKHIFLKLFKNSIYDEALIDRYFDKSYVQQVDGKILKLEAFKKHIKKLKELRTVVDIQFNTVAEENDAVFSNHIVTTTNKDGSDLASHQVIAEFRFKNEKITYCDELTRLISGELSHQELGSTH